MGSGAEDHYATLGVSKDATRETIKKAYRQKVKAAHPDVGGVDNEEFRQVQKAYEVLSSHDKRAEYDLGLVKPRMTKRSAAKTNASPPITQPSVSFAVSTNHLMASVDTSGTTPASGVRFSISWGDGSTSAGPTHTYAKAGSYTISVTGANTVGSDTATKMIVVTAPPPPPPAVAFTVSANYLWVSVDTTDTRPRSGVTFSYSWGDGSVSQVPSHTYAKAGTYTISVTGTDPAGSSSKDTKTIALKSPPARPTVSFTIEVSYLTATVDTSRTRPKKGVTFSYNWGDGSVTANPTHTYAKANAYIITVTATNSVGPSSQYRTITVTEGPPHISAIAFSPDYLTAAVDTSGTRPKTGLTFTYRWGDGSSSSTAIHTYARAGNYTVWIRATNSAGMISETQTTVSVAAPRPPPPARPIISMTVSVDHLTATVDITGTMPATGVSFRHEWGDGRTSGAPSHKYGRPGVYTIRTTASNAGGADIRTATVTATSPPSTAPSTPPRRGSPPHVTFTASMHYLAVSVDASGTTPTTGVNFSYRWGDGSTSNTPSCTATHTYTRADTYTIRVIAKHVDGGRAAATTTIAAIAPPPGPPPPSPQRVRMQPIPPRTWSATLDDYGEEERNGHSRKIIIGLVVVAIVLIGIVVPFPGTVSKEPVSQPTATPHHPRVATPAAASAKNTRAAPSTAGWQIVCDNYYPQSGYPGEEKPCLAEPVVSRQPVSVHYTIQGMQSSYTLMYEDNTVVERFYLFSKAGQSIGVDNFPPTDNTGKHFLLDLNATTIVVVKLVCMIKKSLCHHAGQVLWRGRYTTRISRPRRHKVASASPTPSSTSTVVSIPLASACNWAYPGQATGKTRGSQNNIVCLDSSRQSLGGFPDGSGHSLNDWCADPAHTAGNPNLRQAKFTADGWVCTLIQ